MTKVSPQHRYNREEHFQTSHSNLDQFTANTDNLSQGSRSMGQSDLENDTDIADESSLTTLTDMLKDQLDEMKEANVRRFSKIQKTIERYELKYIQQNNDTEKNLREMKEAITFQHRETRRRLERLEKKTNSRYFLSK